MVIGTGYASLFPKHRKELNVLPYTMYELEEASRSYNLPDVEKTVVHDDRWGETHPEFTLYAIKITAIHLLWLHFDKRKRRSHGERRFLEHIIRISKQTSFRKKLLFTA